MNDVFTVTVLKPKDISQSFTFHANKPADIPISLSYDDSIKIIKYKILHGLYSKDLDELSYEGLYLFAVVDVPFNLLQWYKQVTKNDTLPLRALTFCQLLTNLAEIENDDAELEKIITSHEMKTRLLKNEKFEYEHIASFAWFQNKVAADASTLRALCRLVVLTSARHLPLTTSSAAVDPACTTSSAAPSHRVAAMRAACAATTTALAFGTYGKHCMSHACALCVTFFSAFVFAEANDAASLRLQGGGRDCCMFETR